MLGYGTINCREIDRQHSFFLQIFGIPNKETAVEDKKTEYQDNTDRIEVERRFSLTKRCLTSNYVFPIFTTRIEIKKVIKTFPLCTLDVFCDKFSSRISEKYVVHTKDYKWENGIHYIPVYMVPFL